ncbi:hypothetical protein QBC39DRAFT_317647 [Podospora conica]|nr:hypothetical protein QBC39DRAFT_317647 [Schizothecium conicum]
MTMEIETSDRASPSPLSALKGVRTALVTEDTRNSEERESEPSQEWEPLEERARGPSGKPSGKTVLLGTEARIWTSFVHIIPMVVAGVLVRINLQRWFWFYEADAFLDLPLGINISIQTISNALQLAAKLHELLVVASLAAITVKVVKRKLVESELPLGLLTGAYRVGDLQYFSTGYFWGGVFSTSLLLGLFLLVNTIVATLVGPASAILMVPELDWFPAEDAFSNLQGPGPIIYDSSPNETWPRVLDVTASPSNESVFGCDLDAGRVAYWCPLGGFSTLWNWVAGWGISSLTNSPDFREPSGAVRREIISSSISRGGLFGVDAIDAFLDIHPYLRGNTTYTTTVSMAPLLTIGRLINYLEFKGVNIGSLSQSKNKKFRMTTLASSPIYQPLVQTRCVGYDRDNISDSNEPYFDNTYAECFGDPECERLTATSRWVIPRVLWNLTGTDFGAAFLNPDAIGGIPLHAVVQAPYYREKEEDVKIWLFACVIVAHWAPSVLTVSPSESDVVQSNITDPTEFFLVNYDDFFDPKMPNRSTSQYPMGPAIHFTDGWTNLLDPIFTNVTSITNTSATTDETALSRLLSPLLINLSGDLNESMVFNPAGTAEQKHRAQSTLQNVIGSFVADALARVNSKKKRYAVKVDNSTHMQLISIDQAMGLDARDIILQFENDTVLYGSAKVPLPNLTYEEFRRGYEQNITRFDFEVDKYGYGSGKEGPTMRFALAVMYMYFSLIGLYTIYVAVLIYLRRPNGVPTVDAWGDLQNLLLLAWAAKSDPEHVPGSSLDGAWRKFGIWSSQVGIRVDDTGRAQLQMVTGAGGEKIRNPSPDGMEKLQRDKKYL